MKPTKRKPAVGAVRKSIGVADFKARCLELVGQVGARGARYVITKHGKPIARVTPIAAQQRSLRGLLKDQITIAGDIVASDWTKDWEAAR
jgi:prevent-host-death family protein